MRANVCKGRVRGECHPKAKTPDSDVEMIVLLHEQYGMGYKRLAKKFEIPIRTVRQFCNGSRRGGVR